MAARRGRKHRKTTEQRLETLNEMFDKMQDDFHALLQEVEEWGKGDVHPSSAPTPKIDDPDPIYVQPKILGYIPRANIDVLTGIQPVFIYPFQAPHTDMLAVCLVSDAEEAMKRAAKGEIVPKKRKEVSYTDEKGRKNVFPTDPNEWAWRTVESPFRYKARMGKFTVCVIPSVKGNHWSWYTCLPSKNNVSLRVRGKEADVEKAKAAAVHVALGYIKESNVEPSKCPLPATQTEWTWTNMSALVLHATCAGWGIVIQVVEDDSHDLCHWVCKVYGPCENSDHPMTTLLLKEELPGTEKAKEVKQIMVDKARELWFDRMA